MTFRRLLVIGAAIVAGPPMSLFAQPVLLQIRPRVGDTIHVRLDQRVEMTRRPVECATSSAAPRGEAREKGIPLCAEATRQMATMMEVFSRAIVRRTTSEGAAVLAVTDSIRTASGAGPARNLSPRRVGGRTRTIEMVLAPDGGAEVIDAGASEELRNVFGQMPAMLPRKPVAVGEKWTRQMRVPIAAEAGAMGLARATFQLDSLGDNGDIAYISMRGTLSHDHPDSELSGSMNGAIQLDRRMAWITETRATIDVTSTIVPAGGAPPMRVRTRVTQLLKAGRPR